jgi:hypothetical protein
MKNWHNLKFAQKSSDRRLKILRLWIVLIFQWTHKVSSIGLLISCNSQNYTTVGLFCPKHNMAEWKNS